MIIFGTIPGWKFNQPIEDTKCNDRCFEDFQEYEKEK